MVWGGVKWGGVCAVRSLFRPLIASAGTYDVHVKCGASVLGGGEAQSRLCRWIRRRLEWLALSQTTQPQLDFGMLHLASALHTMVTSALLDNNLRVLEQVRDAGDAESGWTQQ